MVTSLTLIVLGISITIISIRCLTSRDECYRAKRYRGDTLTAEVPIQSFSMIPIIGIDGTFIRLSLRIVAREDIDEPPLRIDV